MASPSSRTEFVRRLIDSRPLGRDEYVEEVLRLERLLANRGSMGMASGMAFLNLLSRYPREYEAIRREIGAEDEDWRPGEERIARLLEERLRLAEARTDSAGTFL